MFLIAGIAWFLNRILLLRFNSGRAFKICPVCAGFAGTWLWMLIGMLLGLIPTSDFQLPTAFLMGGSVVGIAYQIGKNKHKKENNVKKTVDELEKKMKSCC